MKVRVTVTVDVDPVSWDLNYGTGTKAAAVREDVTSYIQHLVHETLNDHDVLLKET